MISRLIAVLRGSYHRGIETVLVSSGILLFPSAFSTFST